MRSKRAGFLALIGSVAVDGLKTVAMRDAEQISARRGDIAVCMSAGGRVTLWTADYADVSRVLLVCRGGTSILQIYLRLREEFEEEMRIMGDSE